MRTMRAVAIALALALPAAPGLAAEIQLEPAEGPTPYETASRAFWLLAYVDTLGISPDQLAAMASELEPIATMRTNVAAQERKLLLAAHDALIDKWNLLLTQEPVPAEVETAVSDTLQKIATQRAAIAQAEQRAYTAILGLLDPTQIMLIEFPPGPFMDLAQQSRAMADQMQMARLRRLAGSLLRSSLERVWSARNPQLYRTQSAMVADELINSLTQQGLLAPDRYDQYLSVILEFFAGIRNASYDEFQAGLRGGQIAMALFDRLGVTDAVSLRDLPRIPESHLREVILAPSGVQLITARAKALRAAIEEAQRVR